MVVELDILKLRMDHPEWKCQGVPQLCGETYSRKLDFWQITGPIGAWLRQRGHPAIFSAEPNRVPDYKLRFDDPNLAMLFKLVWL